MRIRPALYYAGVAVAVALALSATLRLPGRRLEVPFGYAGDGLFYAVLAKAVAEDGLSRFQHIGMPFGVEIADWGPGMPLDLAAMAALVRVFGEAGAAVNAWWLLSVVATGVAAAFALRALGLAPHVAFGLGYLYALSPFAFARNVGHVSLVFHFVPLLALLALVTAEGRPERLGRGGRVAVLAASLGQGLSYVYYSFFACLLLGAAAAIGWLRTRRLATVRLAAAAVLLIVVTTAASLAPSVLYWREHGRNPDLQYKTVAESDLFALKLRHLLLPIPEHPLPPWRALARAADDAQFPGDNENAAGRLGTVGSLGFLGLLAWAVGSAAGLVRGQSPRLAAAAALALVSLLAAQVGGFGSLFALLVSPDIRAWNRIVAFLSFFAFVAAGLGLERLEATAPGRAHPRLVRGGILVLLLLAVADQAGTGELLRAHEANARQFDLDRDLVRRMEACLPPGAMVFQLPHTDVPVEKAPTGMALYDHGRAYLHSRSLRWSWGAIVGRHGNWQAQVQRLPPAALARRLVLAGFSGVWVDRLGYAPPPGRRMATEPRPGPETDLLRLGGEPPETSRDGRVVFVSLEAVRARLLAELGGERFARATERALRPPVVPRFREGFGPDLGDGTADSRDGGPRGRVVLLNASDEAREVVLAARLSSLGAGPERVEVSGPGFRDEVNASTQGASWQRAVVLPPRWRVQIVFSCPARPGANPPPCFRLEGFRAVDPAPAGDERE